MIFANMYLKTDEYLIFIEKFFEFEVILISISSGAEAATKYLFWTILVFLLKEFCENLKIFNWSAGCSNNN